MESSPSISQLILFHNFSFTFRWAYLLPQHVGNDIGRNIHILFWLVIMRRMPELTFRVFLPNFNRHGISLLPKELSSLLPGPFRLWPSPLFPEATVSFGTLSMCLPLKTPLNVGFLSFLTLGNWSSFHNIAPNPDVWSSHHLINVKFYTCLQLWIINSASFLCFQSFSWSYKAITIKNWAEFCNFDSLIIVHDPV